MSLPPSIEAILDKHLLWDCDKQDYVKPINVDVLPALAQRIAHEACKLQIEADRREQFDNECDEAHVAPPVVSEPKP